jgi:hypothetical protein
MGAYKCKLKTHIVAAWSAWSLTSAYPGTQPRQRRFVMPNFLLLLYQSPAKFDKLAPEDIQRIVSKYIAWREASL